MHRLTTSFVLGYHGCDRALGDKLISGSVLFQKSENDYDWLGPGVYFWEANPHRALQFAREKKARNHGVKNPMVVGAVIDLGLCLDLTTADSIEYLVEAYKSLKLTLRIRGQEPPENGPKPWERYLDCAVLRRLHEIVKVNGQPSIDTVRGIFQEGSPIYPGSAFLEKTHVQIAVVNPACVKAVLRAAGMVATSRIAERGFTPPSTTPQYSPPGRQTTRTSRWEWSPAAQWSCRRVRRPAPAMRPRLRSPRRNA